MKGKYKKSLIFISILCILLISIGMASASNDINMDDSVSDSSETILEDADIDDNIISVEEDLDEDINENPIEESPKDNKDKVLSASGDSEPALQASNVEEDALESYSSGSVKIEIENYVDLDNPYYEIAHVEDENGIVGTVTLAIDGKNVLTKKFTKKDDDYYYTIEMRHLKLDKIGYGYHTVKVTYNNGKAKSDSHKVNFVDIPTINYPSSMSVGENQGISIEGAGNLSGSATLYNRVETGKDEYGNPTYARGDAIATAKITKGYGWIPLSGLGNGNYNFQLEYKYGTYEDVETFTVTVKYNSPGFKSSVSPKTLIVGNPITVQLTGPKGTGYAEIYDNGKWIKSVRFNFGTLNEVINGLKIGKHKINIQYSDSDSDLFYSQTYIVNVKDHNIKINLKKVTVKKSAKKLVIKAGLKIDGKVAKKKKLIFKFNKTKYTAKTNKKGIAKITVPKYILKKLKVGKTVKIQVTYGNKTVKQSVKVKK